MSQPPGFARRAAVPSARDRLRRDRDEQRQGAIPSVSEGRGRTRREERGWVGRVRVSLHDEFHARFRCYDLSNDEFRRYREAMDGAEYVRALKAQVATLDRVPAILVRLRNTGLSVGSSDMDPRLRTALQERATATDWLDLDAVKHRLVLIEEKLAQKDEHIFPYQRTGAIWLARKHGALLADDMGLGKLQAISEPVLTPSGWKPIGDLRVGDHVIGSNGKLTAVIAIYPQGRKKQYRITLTDGAWCRAGADHLWYVETPNDRARSKRGRVVSTRDLLKSDLRFPPSIGRKHGNCKWFIPVVAPVSFARKKFALDPYIVGALIANGSLSRPSSTLYSGSKAQSDLIAQRLPGGCRIRRLTYKAALITTDGRTSFRRQYLEALGLVGKSFEKRIPSTYLLGSVQQRLALLQGLMDNDGTVSKDGIVVEYNTTSPGLAKDVLELVRSLGGVAWLSTRSPSYMYRGKRHIGRTDHRIRFSLPDGIVPFVLKRKLRRYRPRTKYPPIHAIDRIEADGYEESVCIRVAATDHLYVTRDYILTHNTVQALIALPANAAVVVVCPSGMKGTWKGQVARWRPDLAVTILKGRTSFRWPKPGEVLICNYDILPDIHDREGVGGRVCDGFLDPRPCPGCRDRLSFAGERGVTKTRTDHEPACSGYLQADLDDPRPCAGCHPFLQLAPRGMVFVLDEAQSLKNESAKRHGKARAIAERVRHKDGFVWLLTGTPLENEASELWAVLRAGTIHGDAFGTRERFEDVFQAQRGLTRTGSDSLTWGMPGAEIRGYLKRVMLRRLLDDVQPQLPSKLRVQNIVDLDKASYHRIDEFLRNTGKTVEQIVRLLELEQIRFQDMSSVRAAIATAKIPRLVEVVEDFEERRVPVVVISDHRAPVETLSQRPGWVHVIGGEGAERMNRAVDEFQNGFLAGPLDPYVVDELGVRRRADPSRRILYPRGIAVTVKAGGTGITLTRAAHMVFVDRAWNPQVNSQAEGRCRRIGSERHKSIEIMDIVSNHPLDARVTEVIVRKTKLFEASINASADRRVVGGIEAEMLRQLREEHEAIAAGRAVRRGPKNDRERVAFATLQETNEAGGSVLVFDDLRDAKIADDLAEQSDRIGLSERQWSLAIVIVRKGRRYDALPPPREPEPVVVQEQFGARDLQSDAMEAVEGPRPERSAEDETAEPPDDELDDEDMPDLTPMLPDEPARARRDGPATFAGPAPRRRRL